MDKWEVKSQQESAILDVVEELATQGENETTYVPKGHMVWWRKSWWIRFENGPRNRRRPWRAATRAAGRAEDRKEDTERKREKRKHVTLSRAPAPKRQCSSRVRIK